MYIGYRVFTYREMEAMGAFDGLPASPKCDYRVFVIEVFGHGLTLWAKPC